MITIYDIKQLHSDYDNEVIYDNNGNTIDSINITELGVFLTFYDTKNAFKKYLTEEAKEYLQNGIWTSKEYQKQIDRIESL